MKREVMELPHWERCRKVTETLQKEEMFERLEKRLQETKSMAKTPAKPALLEEATEHCGRIGTGREIYILLSSFGNLVCWHGRNF